MLCVLIGAASVTLLATVYGFPISATHSIVGGLVAVGMAAKGTASIGWVQLGFTAVGWVLSPVVGGIVSGAFFLALRNTVFIKADPAAASTEMKPAFTAVTAAVLIAFMLLKGPPPIGHMEPVWLAVLIALVAGVGVAAAEKAYCTYGGGGGSGGGAATVAPAPAPPVAAADAGLGKATELTATPIATGGAPPGEPAADEEAAVATQPSASTDSGGVPLPPSLASGAAAGAADGAADGAGSVVTRGDSWAVDDKEIAALDAKAKSLEEAEKPFVALLVASAFTVAFAHGGNDVGNSVGPLAAILGVFKTDKVTAEPHIPFWALCVGGLGFCAGILLLGAPTINTVGSKITKLTPSKSYVTPHAFAAVISVIHGAWLKVEFVLDMRACRFFFNLLLAASPHRSGQPWLCSLQAAWGSPCPRRTASWGPS